MKSNIHSKIIIFGGTGFIGKSFVNHLKLHKEPYLSFGSKDINLLYNTEVKSKLSKVSFKNKSIVFLSALRPKNGEIFDLTIKNLTMLKNLIANININEIKQFIYISSDAVFACKKNITENSIKSSNSLYGLMHNMREVYLLNKIPKNRLTILRPCALYGLNETTFNYGINRFVNEALTNKVINLVGNGEEKRDHVYVEDLTLIIFHSYKKHIFGTFNIATGNSRSFKEIAIIIVQELNQNIRIIKKPRLQQITHKSFNTVHLTNAFLEIKINSINNGIYKFLDHYKI